MGLFENANQDLNYKAAEVDTSSLTQTKYVNSNSISPPPTSGMEEVDLDEEQLFNTYIEEVDDFSQNQYGEYTINKYLDTYADIDGDGSFTVMDKTLLQKYLSEGKELKAGDVDGDGKVTIMDLTCIEKYEKEGTFPVNSLEVANTLDSIKYSNIKTQTEEDLKEKNKKLQLIKNTIGYYKYSKELQDKKDNSRENKIVKNKEKGYHHYLDKDNNKSGNNSHPFGSNEAAEKKNYYYNYYKNNKLSKEEEQAIIDEYGSLEAARDAYETNIASLNYSKKQLDKQIKLITYNNTMNTADFKKWANSKTLDDFDPTKNTKLGNISKYMDSYKYLDASQLAMYNYLLETQGEAEANKFLDIYEDDINQAIGLERANDFINKLDKNFEKIIKEDGTLMDEKDIEKLQSLLDSNSYNQIYDMDGNGVLDNNDLDKLKQYIDVGGEIETTLNNLGITFTGGFQDGWNKFFEGFKYIFDDSSVLSAEEYKMMFIAQKLEQNGTIKGSYEFGQTVGNMVPVIMASALATAATAPFGGEGGAAVFGTTLSAQQIGQITAATLIFSSTFGNSKHQALCNGHSLESAIGYGFLSGVSEAGLETLLGSLPFVGSEAKNIFIAMFKEGLSESAQELVGEMIGYYTLGEEIDVSELSASMGKAFIFGALLSGASNGLSAGMKIVINGVKYKLSSSQLMAFYEASIDPKTGESNGLTLQEFVQENVTPYDADTSVDSAADAPLVKKYMSEQNMTYEQAVEAATTKVKEMGSTPEQVSKKFKSNELSSTQALEYVQNAKALNIITDTDVQSMFSDLVGTELASWAESPAVASSLYTQLLSACSDAKISYDTLKQSLKTLDLMESYYKDAKGMQSKLQSGKGIFETYRTHGVVHIMDVLTMSIKTTQAFQDAGVAGINTEAVMLAAVMHDTGMSGGKQLKLSVGSDGKLKIETIDVQMDGGNIRESHSYNSGVNILENAESLRKMGYSDAQIAEAALLAFAHSKSNSGLNPLTNNPAGWSFAIQALQASLPAEERVRFLNALVDAGILRSTETVGESTATVKAPKRYKTDPDTGKIVLDSKGNPVVDESCYARDKDGNIIYDEDGKPKTTFQGTVKVYDFNTATITRLAYEALSIRIGDALTNNDNGKINQFGGKIIIDETITNYANQWTTEQIIDSMPTLSDAEKSAFKSMPPEAFLEYLLGEKKGLETAASLETKHPKYNADGTVVTSNGKTVYDESTSVVFQVEGEEGTRKTYNKSQEFVLGENNQTYSVNATDDGVEVTVSVKDSNAIPYCTMFAIEERVGELKSFSSDISAVEGAKPITLVIELDEKTKPSIRSLYEQYAKQCAADKKINIKVIP